MAATHTRPEGKTMSDIPWERYFEMDDGEHVVPEAYEVLDALLTVRGMYQFGWNPATGQSGIGIQPDADTYSIEEGLKEIVPYRRHDEEGLCSVGVLHEREGCSFSLMLSSDLEHIELRSYVYGSVNFAMLMPSLEFALTFLQKIPEEYWDEEDLWNTLFPWSNVPGEVQVVPEKNKAIESTDS